MYQVSAGLLLHQLLVEHCLIEVLAPAVAFRNLVQRHQVGAALDDPVGDAVDAVDAIAAIAAVVGVELQHLSVTQLPVPAARTAAHRIDWWRTTGGVTTGGVMTGGVAPVHEPCRSRPA